MEDKSKDIIRDVYFENLNILNCILGFSTNKLFRKSIIHDLKTIYYFDSDSFSKFFLVFFFSILRIQISKLEFKLNDIVDETGELIRFRISRVDLFELQEKITRADLYINLGLDDFASQYILKEICDDGIFTYSSSARILYIIQVVSWHQKISPAKRFKVLLFIDKRRWHQIYKAQSKKYNIELVTYHVKKFRVSKVDIIKFIYGYPKIYKILKNISLYVKK
jgi:hypothetical protein